MVYSDAFFATSAQVLPTLLIAFILEVGSIIKLVVDRIANTKFALNTSLPSSIAASPGKRRELTNWELLRIGEDKVVKKVLIGLAVVAASFVLGEVLSLGALQWPPSTRRNEWLVGLTTTAVALITIMTLLVIVIVPIIRLYFETGDKLFSLTKWQEEETQSEPGPEGGS